MGLFSKLDRASTLVNRMAETVHADLGAALEREAISDQDLRNAVINCMGCEGGASCPEWLEQHASGAEDTPAYCRNRETFLRLQAEV